MFNYNKILSDAAVKFNMQGQNKELLPIGNDKKGRILANIDMGLSKIADDSKRHCIYKSDQEKINKENYKEQLMSDFVYTMNLYMIFASMNNWTDAIVMSDEEQEKLFSLKADDDFNKVYLSIKKMLFNGYFNHNKKDFIFSWKMLNKYAIVDFGFDISEMVSHFDQTNSTK